MNESPTPTKAGTTPTQPTLRSDGLTAPDPQSHDCWPSTPIARFCYRCDIRRHEAETILAEQSACLHPTATCDECGAEIGIVMDVKETR